MFSWVILTRTHCPWHHSFASSKDPHLTFSNLPLRGLNSCCEQFRMRIHGPLVALTPAPLPSLPGTATSYATGHWNFFATFQVLPSVGLLGPPPRPLTLVHSVLLSSGHWPPYGLWFPSRPVLPQGRGPPARGSCPFSKSSLALFGFGVGRGALPRLGDFICFIVKVPEASGWEGRSRHWGRIEEPTTGESPGWWSCSPTLQSCCWPTEIPGCENSIIPGYPKPVTSKVLLLGQGREGLTGEVLLEQS